MLAVLVATAVAQAGVPSPSSAADSPMAGAFGNTIVSEQPDGAVTRTYVDPDGTYRSVTGGAETRGTWQVRKGLICYTATTPAPAAPLCTLGPKKKVGSRWSIFVSDDAKVKAYVASGRP